MTNQQLGNFTDEQVRAKAHKIWQARQESGEPGNADTDWQTAVNELSVATNDPATEKSGLPYWYWIGGAALLGVAAGVVVIALGLF